MNKTWFKRTNIERRHSLAFPFEQDPLQKLKEKASLSRLFLADHGRPVAICFSVHAVQRPGHSTARKRMAVVQRSKGTVMAVSWESITSAGGPDGRLKLARVFPHMLSDMLDTFNRACVTFWAD